MTAPDTTPTVPDEAARRAIVEALHAWCCDHDCQQANEIAGKIARRVLTTLAEAGWVLVPGPVHAEHGVAWTNDQGARLNYPEPDAETARKRVTAIAQILPSATPEVVSHLATEWLPIDGGSTDGGGGR